MEVDTTTDLATSSAQAPGAQKRTAKVKQGKRARRRTRSRHDVASESEANTSSDEDNVRESDKEVGDPDNDDDDDDDEDNLFSPNLPIDRRVVKHVKTSSGSVLYKLANGSLVTYYELERLANIARNQRALRDCGVEAALGAMGIGLNRSGGEGGSEEGDEIPVDEREFPGSRPRIPLPRRQRLPRASKENVS